jgi:hypothetical protein
MPAAADADKKILSALPAEQREIFLDTLSQIVETIHSARIHH